MHLLFFQVKSMSNICTRPRAPDVVPVYVWRWTVLEGNLGKDTATVKSKERASYCRIRKAPRIAARHTVCLPCGWQMSFAADPAAVSHQGRIFLFIYFFFVRVETLLVPVGKFSLHSI